MAVAQDENPLASMWCANVAGPNRRPDRVVPQLGQVPEYAVESSSLDAGHVLHEDELGS
jgi:hypothetical protein